jgi:hypothetical protein
MEAITHLIPNSTTLSPFSPSPSLSLPGFLPPSRSVMSVVPKSLSCEDVTYNPQDIKTQKIFELVKRILSENLLASLHYTYRIEDLLKLIHLGTVKRTVRVSKYLVTTSRFLVKVIPVPELHRRSEVVQTINIYRRKSSTFETTGWRPRSLTAVNF